MLKKKFLCLLLVCLFLQNKIFAENFFKQIKLAEKLYQQKKFTEAVNIYLRQLSQKPPHLAIIFYNLANTYYQLNEYPKALFFFQKAILLNPNDFDNKYNYELTLNKLVLNKKKKSQVLPKTKNELSQKNQVLLTLITEKERLALKKYQKRDPSLKTINKFDW